MRSLTIRDYSKTVGTRKPEGNDQPNRGDAYEPDSPADSGFDPAALEPSADGQGGPAKDAAPDPFDPALLRLSQDFSAAAGVKKALLAVPVRKPHNSWFVR